MDTMNALVWKGDGALSLERRPSPISAKASVKRKTHYA